MELGAAIKVATTIVPCRIVIPRKLRWALTVSTHGDSITDQIDPRKAAYGRNLYQIKQGLPRHHRLHLKEELLPFGLLLGGGELVIREAELLATYHPSPGLRLQDYCPANGAGFPESH